MLFRNAQTASAVMNSLGNMLDRVKTVFSKSSAPRVRAAHIQGIGKRARQEDSFALVNEDNGQIYDAQGMMFCVCDGMGGMKDGKLASETATASLCASFAGFDPGGDIVGQLRQSVEEASEKVRGELGGSGGSTVVAGIIYKGMLYYASVGDSYLYLFRGGKLLRLNTAHNLCHQKYLEEIRNGRLDPTEGRYHIETAALTGFLGMQLGAPPVDGSVKPLPLRAGDVVLACSDGVGGVLSHSELCMALSGSSVSRMCRRISRDIRDANAPFQDNYTALVIGYN